MESSIEINTQEKLNEVYRPLVDRNAIYERLGKSEETDAILRDLNGPFLIAADPEYEASQPKVMIIGQENNGWIDGCNYYEFISTKDIEDALAVYRGFNIAEYGPGAFGHYFSMFRDRIAGSEGDQKKRAVLYSNLFKLNQGTLQMIGSPYLKQVLTLQEGIFHKEIEILAPEVVIFLTGPDYDSVIRRFYPDVVFTSFNSCTDRELALVSAVGLPRLSFRTYHPGFINRDRVKRIRYYDEIIKRVLATQRSEPESLAAFTA